MVDVRIEGSWLHRTVEALRDDLGYHDDIKDRLRLLGLTNAHDNSGTIVIYKDMSGTNQTEVIQSVVNELEDSLNENVQIEFAMRDIKNSKHISDYGTFNNSAGADSTPSINPPIEIVIMKYHNEINEINERNVRNVIADSIVKKIDSDSKGYGSRFDLQKNVLKDMLFHSGEEYVNSIGIDLENDLKAAGIEDGYAQQQAEEAIQTVVSENTGKLSWEQVESFPEKINTIINEGVTLSEKRMSPESLTDVRDALEQDAMHSLSEIEKQSEVYKSEANNMSYARAEISQFTEDLQGIDLNSPEAGEQILKLTQEFSEEVGANYQSELDIHGTDVYMIPHSKLAADAGKMTEYVADQAQKGSIEGLPKPEDPTIDNIDPTVEHGSIKPTLPVPGM